MIGPTCSKSYQCLYVYIRATCNENAKVLEILNAMQVLFDFWVLKDASGMSGAKEEGEEEEEAASSSSPKEFMHSTNTLEHTLIIVNVWYLSMYS